MSKKKLVIYINEEGSFGLERYKQIRASREQEDVQLCPSQSDMIIELLAIRMIEWNKEISKTVFHTLRLY